MKLYIFWETVSGPFHAFRMGHLEKKMATVKIKGKNANSSCTSWIPLSIRK